MLHLAPAKMDEQQLASLFVAKKSSTKKRKIALVDEAKESEAEAIEPTGGGGEIEIPGISTKRSNDNSKPLPETTASKLEYAYEAPLNDESASSLASSTATASAEYDTEFDRDHRARRQEALERSKRLAESKQLDSEYHGLKGYQQFLIQKDTAKANAASDKNRVAGPVRASANLRVTCRFDYRPDLCKDYYETGFCGFGDSCIFLHDRSEYKSSYQLEKEWEAEQERKRLEAEHAVEMVNAKETPAKPVDCPVCRQPFKRPVKTLCSHYFCEMCVLRQTKCPVCKAALLGSFKPASKELNDK